MLEDLCEALALQFILQIGFQRINIGRQPAFFPEVVVDVFVTWHQPSRVRAERRSKRDREVTRIIRRMPIVFGFISNEMVINPDRHAVFPPETTQCPARKLFAGIPFSLPVMEQSAGSELRPQPLDKFAGQQALMRADGGIIPLRSVRIVNAHESRLSTHRQPHIMRAQVGIYAATGFIYLLPLFLCVGFGHAR